MVAKPESAFHVWLLPESELRLALPLVQLLYPSLIEQQWLDYACGRVLPGARPRRVLVARNPKGYLHGLCTVADGFDPRCGRILDVDDFVVANFLDSRSVAHLLLTGVEELARKGDYHAVRVNLADGNLPHRQAVADAIDAYFALPPEAGQAVGAASGR